MASYTVYPNAIDGTAQLPIAIDNISAVKSEVVNRQRDAILAIETELGIQPSSTYSTVRARLDAISALLETIIDGGGNESIAQVLKDGTQIRSIVSALNFTGANITVTSAVENGQVNISVTAPEAQTLADTLIFGNTTSGTDLEISSGDSIIGEATIGIISGDGIGSGSGGNLILQSGNGGASNASSGNITITPGAKSGSGSQGIVQITGAGSEIRFDQVSAVPILPGAGKGAVWLKNDSTTTLYFTDSAGIDHLMSSGGYLDVGNSGALINVNWASAAFQRITINANSTITFSPPTTGAYVELYLIQDGTGGRTITLPATVTITGGGGFNTAPGSVTIFRGVWTGTEYRGTLTPVSGPPGVVAGPANSLMGGAAVATGESNIANGLDSRVGGLNCRTGNLARAFTVSSGGTTITIAGDVRSEFVNGRTFNAIRPTAPTVKDIVRRTVNSVPAFAAGNTTFSISVSIDGTTTGGFIVDEYTGLCSNAEGNQCIAAGTLGQSKSWGFNNQAIGTASTSFGGNCTSSGDNALSFGEACVASGIYSTSFGNGTISRGQQSTACGISNGVLGSDGLGSYSQGINCAAYGFYSRVSGRTNAVWGTAGDCSGDSCLSTGRAASATGTSCRAGHLVDAFTISASGTLVTIAGDRTTQYTNGDVVSISPTAPAHLASVQGTVNSVPAFAAGNTTFNLLAAIDATTTGGSIVDETQGTNAFAIGASCVASRKQTFARGSGCSATADNASAVGIDALADRANKNSESSGKFTTQGDNQRSWDSWIGTTPGSGAAETVVLQSGALTAVPLKASTAYTVTVKGIATKMGLGAAARQTMGFYFMTVVSTTSAGTLTIEALQAVTAPIRQGAAFVGADVTLTSGGANLLALTARIGAGLTIASRWRMTVELEELVGT